MLLSLGEDSWVYCPCEPYKMCSEAYSAPADRIVNTNGGRVVMAEVHSLEKREKPWVEIVNSPY